MGPVRSGPARKALGKDPLRGPLPPRETTGRSPIPESNGFPSRPAHGISPPWPARAELEFSETRQRFT